jgi:D-lyxose ketol-isomerase
LRNQRPVDSAAHGDLHLKYQLKQLLEDGSEDQPCPSCDDLASNAALPHERSKMPGGEGVQIMKRSAVNQIIREADAFIRSHGYQLPPFAYWTPDFFRQMKGQARAIIEARLGWDITDYGEGRFGEEGLFLFTVRNGHVDNLRAGKGVVYAEKAMISRTNQISPNHRHNIKTEDIINRGGGVLAIELLAAAADGSIDRRADVSVMTDGMTRTLPAGGILRLDPGESVTLEPRR